MEYEMRIYGILRIFRDPKATRHSCGVLKLYWGCGIEGERYYAESLL